MTANTKPARQLTGRHVLISVIVFFGIIIAVNAVFIVAAIQSFSGEDVKGSYRQGLDYNKRIEARATELAMGWSVRGNVIKEPETKLVFSFSDADGDALKGMTVSGVLRHPADRSLDIPLIFMPQKDGIYIAEFEVDSLYWRFIGKAKTQGHDFLFEYDVALEP